MSGQAIVDPEELEKFARNLAAFNQELEEKMRRLQNDFGRLGDTWRDQEHARYAQEFLQTMRVLEHFKLSTDQQIPFLQKKARIIRQYLSTR